MRDPDATRETILKKSGVLFNTQGYKATSISHITDATGFTKGAIYRHFSNKDALEMETLTHLGDVMFAKLRARIKGETTAGKKLRTLFRFFESYISNPPLKGGCPILNVAIEADDANPALRKAALKMLLEMRQSVISILAKGVKYKQIKPAIDKELFATMIIASLEGAIMMSKLSGLEDDIKTVVKFLDRYLEEYET
ncbi:MAG: TetR/AcrR family transcriptional regulator [Chryseolinea sp.]